MSSALSAVRPAGPRVGRLSPRKTTFRQAVRKKLRPLLWTISGTLFFGGWEAFSRSGAVSPIFLPPPSTIGTTLVRLMGTGDFWSDFLLTGEEFAAGFLLAVVVGVPLGLLVGWYRRVYYTVNPFLSSLYALPRVALLPWIMLWLGLDFAPKVAMTFLGAVLPITINTLDGVRTVDAGLLRVARSFNAPQSFLFRTLVLPSVVPFTVTGARIGLGTGLIGTIVAEFVTARNGIGYMMHVAGHNLQTDLVFVGIVVIAAWALLLTALVSRIESYFQRWRPQ